MGRLPERGLWARDRETVFSCNLAVLHASDWHGGAIHQAQAAPSLTSFAAFLTFPYTGCASTSLTVQSLTAAVTPVCHRRSCVESLDKACWCCLPWYDFHAWSSSRLSSGFASAAALQPLVCHHQNSVVLANFFQKDLPKHLPNANAHDKYEVRAEVPDFMYVAAPSYLFPPVIAKVIAWQSIINKMAFKA